MRRRRSGFIAAIACGVACASSGDTNNTGPATFGQADSSSTAGSATSAATTGDPGMTSMVDATGAPDTSAGSDGVDTGSSDTTGGGTISCADDPAACTTWILPVGNTDWSAVALDAASSLAPAGSVRAAFDLEGPNEGFVFTDGQYHVVDLVTREWTRSANRDNDLPELAGETLTAANAVPPYWGGGMRDVSGVTFYTATDVYIYEYDLTSESFAFVEALADYGPNWAVPEAPAPAEIRASWLDVTNDAGWYTADIMALCGVAGDPGPYVGFVGADAAFISDAGYCFEFDDPVPYASFTPFTYDGAPPIDRIGAGFYNEVAGLWLFAEN